MSVSWRLGEARFSDRAGDPAASRKGTNPEVGERVMMSDPSVEVKERGPPVRRL
jgi:hypothetical protein